NIVGVLGLNYGTGDVIISETPYVLDDIFTYNSIFSDGIGILGYAQGNVTIEAGTVTSGSAILTLDNIQYSGGIIGVSTAGNVDITAFGEVIATGGYGVYGESWDGNVQILVGGDVGGGNIPPLYGVAGFSKGDVKIDLAEDVTLTASLGGIVGYSD